MECNLLRVPFSGVSISPEQCVNPLQLKGQVELTLASVTLPFPPSPSPINHFWQVAGKQLRITNYDCALEHRKPPLTCLLLSVSPNVTKEQM